MKVKQKEVIQQTFYKRKIENGYIHILVDGKYILEHRFLVEMFMGRNLSKEEKVHHTNENKLDNRIENLVLFPNNKSHIHHHRQIKQWGYTNPRKIEIKTMKKYMESERQKNFGAIK